MQAGPGCRKRTVMFKVIQMSVVIFLELCLQDRTLLVEKGLDGRLRGRVLVV